MLLRAVGVRPHGLVDADEHLEEADQRAEHDGQREVGGGCEEVEHEGVHGEGYDESGFDPLALGVGSRCNSRPNSETSKHHRAKDPKLKVIDREFLFNLIKASR